MCAVIFMVGKLAKYLEYVPGPVLHKKSLQNQTGVETLVGNQKRIRSSRRPADKPLIFRSSNGYRVPPLVYLGFPLFVPPKVVENCCRRCPRGQEWRLAPRWADRSAYRTVSPRSASYSRHPSPVSNRSRNVRVLKSIDGFGQIYSRWFCSKRFGQEVLKIFCLYW